MTRYTKLPDHFREKRFIFLLLKIKRAADSISLNIAEGSTGQSDPEFRKFLGYSIRSAIEVVGCPYLAKRRDLIVQKNFKRLYDSLELEITKLQALRKSIK